MDIKVIKLKCLRCGHEWIPRMSDVRQCPKCRTTRWDTPRPKEKE